MAHTVSRLVVVSRKEDVYTEKNESYTFLLGSRYACTNTYTACVRSPTYQVESCRVSYDLENLVNMLSVHINRMR